MDNKNVNKTLELFHLDELESRLEMKKWVEIEYHPCECPKENG